MSDSEEQLLHLPINSLQPNPLQPRGAITQNSIEELITSVKQHGVIEPLVAAQTPAGYQIIAGERRWRAAKAAGLEIVPVLVKKTTPKGMLEMAIVENVQRSDLNPIDRAKAFERLMLDYKYQNQDVADRVGKSPAYVSNSLKLLTLPDALKDGLVSGLISEGHARALSSIPDVRAMVEAFKTIVRENGSVRMAEELARRYKSTLEVKENPKEKTVSHLLLSEELDQIQRRLQEVLGKNPNVVLKQSRRETKLQIVLKGRPEENQAKLEKISQLLNQLDNDSST